MNREIKFRAWDKRKKRFVYFELFQGINSHTPEIYIKGQYLQEDFEDWQQYTGLKDKRGQEIYEGDIVKTEDDKYYPIKIVSHTAGIINEHDGDWDEWYCGFDLGVPNDECHVLHYQLTNQVEVLGNVYENPEL